MAITERTIVKQLELLDDGPVQLVSITIVERDGVEIARSPNHRVVLTPSDDIAELPADIQAAIKAHWTPERCGRFQQLQLASPTE